jgi:hypothetical protein
VVREGISEKEWLITKGMHRARPGQRVTTKRVALTVSTAAEGGPERKAKE